MTVPRGTWVVAEGTRHGWWKYPRPVEDDDEEESASYGETYCGIRPMPDSRQPDEQAGQDCAQCVGLGWSRDP